MLSRFRASCAFLGMTGFVGLTMVVTALVATQVSAQPASNAPVQRYELLDGSVIEHFQYDGVLRRIDKEGRQRARVKVPKSTVITDSTRVVVSETEAKLLVVYSGDEAKWPPKHKVLFLDAVTLKTGADLPLGDCSFIDFRAFADNARLLCQQSQDPSDKKKRPFAYVALDLNRGSVTRWFALGGERKGKWVGPMFFGYSDDAFHVRVEPGPCMEAERRSTADAADTSPNSGALPIDIVSAGERPASILIVGRYEGSSKGEVWFVGPDAADSPHRVATLSRLPQSAVLCGDQLQIIGGWAR